MAEGIELNTVQAVKASIALANAIKAVGSAALLVDKQIDMLGRSVNDFSAVGKRMQTVMRSNAVQSRLTAKAATEQARRFRTLAKEMQAVIPKARNVSKDFRDIGRQMQVVRRSSKPLTRDFSDVGRQMQVMMRSAKPLVKDFSALGVQMQRVRRSAAPLGKDFSDIGRQMQVVARSQRQFHKAGADTSTILKDIGSSAVITFGPLSGVGSRIIALAAIIRRGNAVIISLTLGLTALIGSFIGLALGAAKAGLKMQKIMGTLRAATGSAAQARKEFMFVSGIAEDMGLNVASSAEQFAKLSAAAKGTKLEGEGAREIFEGIALASTAMRLSTEQTTGALRAIEQMISKGNVQAEELRGQLGERLPGAFQLAATAMGVTTRELNKMLEQGEVLAEDLLPKLGKLLKETFSAEAASAAGEFSAALERFKTQMFLLLDELERRSDLLDFLAELLDFGAKLEKGLRTTSVRGEFILLAEEFASAEKALARLQTVSQDEIKAFSTSQLEEFNIQFKRSTGDFIQAFDALIGFTRDKEAELAELEIRGPNLRGLELARFIELRDVLKEIGETGGLAADASVAASAMTANLRLGGVSLMAPIPEVGRLTAVPDLPSGSFENAEKGIEVMEALNKAINELKFPGDVGDDLAELVQEFENLGKTELQIELAELDVRLQEIISSIKELSAPDGIPEDVFEALKAEGVEDATAAIKALKDEAKSIVFDEAAASMKELTNEVDLNIGLLRLRIEALKTSNEHLDDAALAAELMAEAMKETKDLAKALGDDAVAQLNVGLVEGRTLVIELEDEFGALTESIKDAATEADRLAKAIKKEKESFEKARVAIESEIKVLKQRIDTEGEMGDLLAFELKLKEKFPHIDAALIEALTARKGIMLELKDLFDAEEKARKKALSDETALEKKKQGQLDKLNAQIASTNTQISIVQLRIAGETELANMMELQNKASKTFNLLTKEQIALLVARQAVLSEIEETEKLAGGVRDMQRANAVLRLRIRGEEELAGLIETRFELMEKFPGKTAEELAELMKLTNTNKELTEVLKEQNEMEKIRKELAADFGKVIAKSFEDAIIAGKSLSDVLQTLLDDIQRIILRVLVTKPLENFLTGVLTGEDLTGSKAGPGGTPFFGGALGKLFSSGSEAPGNAGGGRAGGVGTAGVGGGFVAKDLEKVGEAARTTAGKFEGRLGRSVEEVILVKTTEKVTTASLTSSLIEFQLAVRAATTALQAMAAGGAAGGGEGIISSLLPNTVGGPGSFGGSNPFEAGFSGNPHFHKGGTVTRRSGASRPEGLRSDEVSAVLQVGEKVIPRGQSSGSDAPVVNLTQVIHTEDVPAMRRSARSNLRSGAKLARTAFKRV